VRRSKSPALPTPIWRPGERLTGATSISALSYADGLHTAQRTRSGSRVPCRDGAWVIAFANIPTSRTKPGLITEHPTPVPCRSRAGGGETPRSRTWWPSRSGAPFDATLPEKRGDEHEMALSRVQELRQAAAPGHGHGVWNGFTPRSLGVDLSPGPGLGARPSRAARRSPRRGLSIGPRPASSRRREGSVRRRFRSCHATARPPTRRDLVIGARRLTPGHDYRAVRLRAGRAGVRGTPP